MSTLRRGRQLAARSRERLTGHEVGLRSAGLTVYGAITVVPSTLAAIALAGVLLGPQRVSEFGGRLAASFPDAMGADRAVEGVLAAGLSLSWWGILVAVFMGSGYGSGVRSALRRLAGDADHGDDPAWRPRLLTLPLLGMAPLMLAGLLAAAPFLQGLSATGGAAGTAVASYLSLTLVWVLLWAPLTWTYRVVGPGRPGWAASFGGAVLAAAFVSGFLQGFLVFLAVPVDLGRPFGGLIGVGVATVLLLWLWVLHLVLLVGYAVTWAIEDLRRP